MALALSFLFLLPFFALGASAFPWMPRSELNSSCKASILSLRSAARRSCFGVNCVSTFRCFYIGFRYWAKVGQEAIVVQWPNEDFSSAILNTKTSECRTTTILIPKDRLVLAPRSPGLSVLRNSASRSRARPGSSRRGSTYREDQPPASARPEGRPLLGQCEMEWHHHMAQPGCSLLLRPSYLLHRLLPDQGSNENPAVDSSPDSRDLSNLPNSKLPLQLPRCLAQPPL